MKSELQSFLQTSFIPFDRSVNLSCKTWIKRGGTADFWVKPQNIDQLKKLIIWCQKNDCQFDLIGSSSNCYFLNSYNTLLVISTLKLNKKQFVGDHLVCECGYKMSSLSKFCINNGYAKYDGFLDLPGTIGGAIVNNSGCYGSLIQDVLYSVDLIQAGVLKTYSTDDLKFSHRNSALKSKDIEGVILSAKFRIDVIENIDILKERAEKFKIERKKKNEFAFPGLGSTLSSFEIKDKYHFYRALSFALRFMSFSYLDAIKIKTKVYLYFNKTKKFRQYVSPLGMSTFLWKDSNADEAFKEYKKFIEQKSKDHTFEIQIRGEIR